MQPALNLDKCLCGHNDPHDFNNNGLSSIFYCDHSGCICAEFRLDNLSYLERRYNETKASN